MCDWVSSDKKEKNIQARSAFDAYQQLFQPASTLYTGRLWYGQKMYVRPSSKIHQTKTEKKQWGKVYRTKKETHDAKPIHKLTMWKRRPEGENEELVICRNAGRGEGCSDKAEIDKYSSSSSECGKVWYKTNHHSDEPCWKVKTHIKIRDRPRTPCERSWSGRSSCYALARFEEND